MKFGHRSHVWCLTNIILTLPISVLIEGSRMGQYSCGRRPKITFSTTTRRPGELLDLGFYFLNSIHENSSFFQSEILQDLPEL